MDASDVALIAFFSQNTTRQHSQIVDNTVLSAGNDAFAGLGTDQGMLQGAVAADRDNCI